MFTEFLSKIYYDYKNPGSLGGVKRLLGCASQLHVSIATRQMVQEYLKNEQTYTLHKPARRRVSRKNTYVTGIDAPWQADLADMQGTARQNGKIKYILTVIDVFSKFSWAISIYFKDV